MNEVLVVRTGVANLASIRAALRRVGLEPRSADDADAVRAAADTDTIAADGFSCRHQIADGTGRAPRHVAKILCDAVEAANDGT